MEVQDSWYTRHESPALCAAVVLPDELDVEQTNRSWSPPFTFPGFTSHGVFAPGAKLRPFLLPQASAEEASAGLEVAARKERMKERTPRVDFRRVAEEDVRLQRVRRREVWRQA